METMARLTDHGRPMLLGYRIEKRKVLPGLRDLSFWLTEQAGFGSQGKIIKMIA